MGALRTRAPEGDGPYGGQAGEPLGDLVQEHVIGQVGHFMHVGHTVPIV
ncbi:hypothetical protein ABZ554_11195 [Streptomyces sp. NPDC020125]